MIISEKLFNGMRISEVMDCSNSVEFYCDKCKKVTVWFLQWGKSLTGIGFFTRNALLDGWARWVFPQYGMRLECETRIQLQEAILFCYLKWFYIKETGKY